MSGHSKWSTIKHKKGLLDAARGKVFTKHAKLIEIAARKGGNPDLNPTLRTSIDNAKTDNVPNANIDRAIKKGSGELKDGSITEEIIYEGYGPGGIALLIEVLTDNRNRTVASLKTILNKNGGNIGGNGSVAWMFKRKGVIEIDLEDKNQEEIELQAIDAGADDVEISDQVILVTCRTDNYLMVKETLQNAGLKILSAKIAYFPDTYVKIADSEQAKKILQLIEKLEEDDDVNAVASNFDIPEEMMAKF